MSDEEVVEAIGDMAVEVVSLELPGLEEVVEEEEWWDGEV